MLLSSTVRELPGKLPKTFGEVRGTSGEVRGRPRSSGQPDSFPATRQRASRGTIFKFFSGGHPNCSSGITSEAWISAWDTETSAFLGFLGRDERSGPKRTFWAGSFSIGVGKRGLLEKGSFQKSPFSRDFREFRDSRVSRELPDCGKERRIRPFSRDSREFRDLRDSRDSSSEKTPFVMTPFSGPDSRHPVQSFGQTLQILEKLGVARGLLQLETFLAGALYREFRESMRILTTFLGKTHRNPS